MDYKKDESFINQRIEEQKDEIDKLTTRLYNHEFTNSRFVELTYSAESQLQYFLDLQKQLNK
jgi:hypothetical protein